MSASNVLNLASKYVAEGYSVVPIAPDGTKRPSYYDAQEGKYKPASWKARQETKPTEAELLALFPAGHKWGIGLVQGAVSGNAEVMDFDDPDIFDDFYARCVEGGIEDTVNRLVRVQTPSGGAHLYYRLPTPPPGNLHLAMRPIYDESGAGGSVKMKALIETRGEGGQAVAPGSPGECHPSGNVYRKMSGDFRTVPLLLWEERDQLHAVAMSFHQKMERTSATTSTGESKRRDAATGGMRPGDDYNERATGAEVLEIFLRHGWQEAGRRAGGVIDLTRPGKSVSEGSSGTLNHCGEGVFFCFSSSASPFEQKRAYRPFAVYALLEHDGDFAAAASALTRKGYGEPPEIRKRSVTSITPEQMAKESQAHVVPVFDGPPRPLAAELLPVPAFDCNLLPLALRAWVLDITQRVSCPIEFVVAALMVALSAAIGRRVGIRPKRHDDWTVICNLWGAALGLPGVMKTPAVNEALAPLKRIQAAAKERYDEEVELYELDVLTAKAQAEAAKKELGKEAAKPGADRLSLRAFASERRPELPDPPTRTRFIVNDATPEAMGLRLNENPFGLLYFSDELLTFLYSLDKPGYEGARQFYLQCWNGDGPHTYDRVGRGTLDIEACCVSIFGTTQPGPFAKYLRGAASGAEADGFASRFSVMVYPDLPRHFDYVDRYPDAAARAAAHEVFDRLTSLTAERVGAQVDEFKPVPFVRFDAEAQEFFDEWYTALRNRLLSESDTALMQLHLNKYPKLMPSLALILFLANERGGSVPLSAAKAAADWCDFLEAHARRIYHAATEGDISGAATLAERIRVGKLESPFTYREVSQKSWVGLTAPDRINAAIARLVEYDWLVAEDAEYDGAGRPKATRYHINPLARASEKIAQTPYGEPTKPTKPQNETFVGFVGSPHSVQEEISVPKLLADATAERFLIDLLKDGPVHTQSARNEAERAGISIAELNRAVNTLNIGIEKNEKSGGQFWFLPQAASTSVCNHLDIPVLAKGI